MGGSGPTIEELPDGTPETSPRPMPGAAFIQKLEDRADRRLPGTSLAIQNDVPAVPAIENGAVAIGNAAPAFPAIENGPEAPPAIENSAEPPAAGTTCSEIRTRLAKARQVQIADRKATRALVFQLYVCGAHRHHFSCVRCGDDRSYLQFGFYAFVYVCRYGTPHAGIHLSRNEETECSPCQKRSDGEKEESRRSHGEKEESW